MSLALDQTLFSSSSSQNAPIVRIMPTAYWISQGFDDHIACSITESIRLNRDVSMSTNREKVHLWPRDISRASDA